MGIESRKAPPLPAPTESESLTTPTELATDISRTADDKSSYSLPDDGTPVTIKTRGHRANKSQTSLLIEYFEGGKSPRSSPDATSSSKRKPSVRVRLTPSKARGKNDRIQITETKSSRKSSLSQRAATASPTAGRSQVNLVDPDDTRSMNSYASATEESNVSRNPIEVEITPGHYRRRDRKVSSPLIPATDSKASSYMPPDMSDISAIPTDSFLDGSGGTTVLSREEKRSNSPSRGEALAAGVAAGLVASAVSDRSHRKHRSGSHDRSREKILEKSSKTSDRKHKSKSRTSSLSEKDTELSRSSQRRRARAGHKESLVSAVDSSVLSSQVTPSHRSYDSYSSSKVSINNPKLLETVEDAIRRLILPELDAIKRERSQRETRETRKIKDRDSLSSLTSASREDISITNNKKSGDVTHSVKSRDREARNDLSPHSSIDQVSVESIEAEDDTPRRGKDRLADAAALGGVAAAGAALGAVVERSRTDEKRQRRRRRAKTPERGRAAEEYDEVEHEVIPPMPLASEVNQSELTRTSILSADTDRPHSASEEMTPVREVSRGVASMESIHDTPTPTRTPNQTLHGLGATHANISHGDLKALPRKGAAEYDEEYEDSELSQRYSQERDEYDDEYDEAGHLAEPGMYEESGMDRPYYNSQDVPPPLRYVPYQQERRGLSPIQSVSGYTEGESEINHRRDSRATYSELSSPGKSPGHDRGFNTPSSVSSNMRSRAFGDEESSVRSSGHYRNTTYTEDSELDHITSGQAVRGVGANPDIIDSPIGVESHVASLVDGSVLEPSLLSGGQDYRDSQLSYDSAGRSRMSYEDGGKSQLSYEGGEKSQLSYEDGGKSQLSYDDGGISQLSYDDGGMSLLSHEGRADHSSRPSSPAKRSVQSRVEAFEERSSPAPSKLSRSNASREFSEYEMDEYGRKVPKSKYRQSPTESEQRITNAAVGLAAAAALKAKNDGHHSPTVESVSEEQYMGEGVSRNRSFKERAKNGYRPNTTPRHSVDRLSDGYQTPKMVASGLPDANHPMPEIGYYDEEHQTPSVVQGPLGGSQHGSHEQWAEEHTPTQEKTFDFDRAATPKASEKDNTKGQGLGLQEAAAVATLATAGALAAKHSRQPSQEQEDEWQRNSEDRKRDTLVTNPYEGTSPIANIPGIDGYGGTDVYRRGFNTGSPGLPQGDEGYISAAPNEARDAQDGKGKGVGFVDQASNNDDPFYNSMTMPKHTRHLSGMSQAMGSPLYDPATGTGIDRIQSKDIIALMEHLMVRDAQRSARDTEMLVTLVRSAAEMRNSFNDIKRLLADTEDQIIGEVKDNTEKTVQRHLGGPRPIPGSARGSLQLGSQAGTIFDDLPAKKRNLFRRALKGLSAKGTNDLGRIEDMLMQLLTDVDVLKHQSVPTNVTSTRNQSMDNLQADMPYDEQEPDRGYEPEGNAGTSTASHGSQSGHLSIPQSRGNSTKQGYERKFSDHRISTVPEDNEDEYDNPRVTAAHKYENVDLLMSPAVGPARGSSVPLGTPPQPSARATKESFSNENTPLTDTSKKHKSRGSSSFFPKISRWSETTTSSLGKVFRNSGNPRKQDQNDVEEFLQHPPSRSGSDLNDYNNYQTDPYEDKLHSGFSEQDLPVTSMPEESGTVARYELHDGPPAPLFSTPEDPKYKAHRNSLNLQHPQPRPGQTERFRTALESSAQDYDTPMSPRSTDWAGSATSLNRFPEQRTQRYSDQTAADEYAYNAASSPAGQGPPRPPKEPLDSNTPARNERINKLQKKPVGGHSPLPYHSVESGYGTATATVPSYHSGSPKLENRNLSGALNVPARRPSGPRAMTPSRGASRSRGSEDDQSLRSPAEAPSSAREERRRKRDTFGTVTSQESETF
ncbi:uncharacterized protein BCR38DRAFT_455739 [Pseudomassariella vexata]|uniref:Uncharacterized protein n=1 Tax=Pseudomassariella vexata TaxID=1141098 RepID=A0A1Y2EBG3_9PEZI|nr:uncharacterized protein BCR38DRAFT_455739 [Pseudomassariella vexata]ORY68919.1 hypothetical protein BCR38DRAFT_455739 [Pseudomassariella vexata]